MEVCAAFSKGTLVQGADFGFVFGLIPVDFDAVPAPRSAAEVRGSWLFGPTRYR